MKITRRAAALGSVARSPPGALSSRALALDGPLTDLVEGAEDFEAASDAYIYGYPLVTMEMTRRVITNVPAVEGTRGPMGHIIKLRAYPNASYRDVTAPNADTLYTTAFFDVGEEPWMLSVPDMKGRYFLLPFLDGWTTCSRFREAARLEQARRPLSSPGPAGLGRFPPARPSLKSPTAIVWLLGRIYCAGTPEDYAAVHALQDQFKLAPLSTWGRDYTPPAGKVDPAIDMKTAVRDQVNALSTTQYFALLADLMKRNPPAPADAPALDRFKAIGLAPGATFDGKTLDSRWDGRLPQLSFDRIKLQLTSLKRENGWLFTTKTGLYGTDYIQRAFITAFGLGANRPQDAVYPMSQRASLLEPYEGSRNYVLRFPKGQLPPAKGFWSLTMYDEAMFFAANPLNRYSMSLRTNPKFDPDGSLPIYIQNESPGADKEANWLPAPKDKFHLMLRLYWPAEDDPSILDGSWAIPAVTRA